MSECIIEQRQTEVKLNQNEEKHRHLKAHIPGMVYRLRMYTDASFSFSFVDDASKLLFDIPPDDLIENANLLFELIHPDDDQQFFASKKKSATTLTPWREVFRLIVNGETRWFDGMSQPEIQSNGDILWEGIILEITDRMKTIASLKESEQKLSDIIAASPVGIAIYNGAGQCVSTNDSLAKMIGATKQQVLRQNYHKVESWKRSGLLETARKVVKTKSAKRHEVVTLTSFRKNVFLDCHLVPFGTDGLLFMAQDITECKQTEGALRKVLRHLANSQKLAKAGSFDWDIQTGEVKWSDEVYRIFGLDPNTFHPKIDSIMKRFHPEDRKLHETLITEAISNYKPYSFEARIVAEDGSIRFLISTSEGYFDDDGNLIQISGTVQDITERKYAELELMQRERFLNSIFDQNPYPIWISDDQGTLIRINRACCEMLNIQEEEVIGKYNILKDEIVIEQGRLPLVQSVFKKGRTVNFIIIYDRASLKHLKLKQTADVVLDVTISPIKNEANKITNAVIIHRDITEQKRSETALQISEERLQQAIRVGNIGIFDRDYAADKYYYSTQLLQIFGLDKAPTLGLFNLVYAEDLPKISTNLMRALDPAEDGIFDDECRIIHSDGNIRWVSLRSLTFFDGEGKQRYPVRTIGAVQNITERKQWETVLKISEERLRQAVRAGNIGIFEVDHTENTTFCSPECLQIYGVDKPLNQDEFLHLIYPEDRERVFSAINRSYDPKSEDFFDVEYRFIRPDGVLRWIETHSLTFFEGEAEMRRPVRTIGAVRDITERKQLEEQLVQSQKMEAIGQLAGGIAHDFNNMLSVILGHVELMKFDLSSNDPLFTNVLEIENAALHSRDITHQLLAFSRKQVIAPKTVNLNDLIENIKNTLAKLIGENIELGFSLQKDLWNIRIEPAQVDQILFNLAVNARDAMPEGGSLTIETSNRILGKAQCDLHPECRPGHYVLLSVADDGVGMDKKTLSHLFEPFYTTKDTGQGTGLGLATVYGIVSQNGGFINVNSRPGKGTTFKLHIPRFRGEVKEEKVARESTSSKLEYSKILLVEDDDMVRRMTTAILERMGYFVEIAENPSEALAIMEEKYNSIDLLITDVVMPQMSGPELIAKIRKITPELKVLYMSGFTENVIVRQGVLKDGIHFIKKPFSVGDLSRKVRETIEDNEI